MDNEQGWTFKPNPKSQWPEPTFVVIPKGIDKVGRLCCGCGRSEEFWQVVKDVLTACDGHPCDDEEYRKKQEQRFEEMFGDIWTGNSYKWFALYVIGSDELDLMEHGGNISGSWLTRDGELALAFLIEWGIDWQETKGVDFRTSDGHYIGGESKYAWQKIPDWVPPGTKVLTGMMTVTEVSMSTDGIVEMTAKFSPDE
jgi:hypothetical protein